MAQDTRRRAKASPASEVRCRSLLARIPDVVWTADAGGRRIFVSPNVERVCGFTPEEIYAGGTGVWPGRVHPEDRERVSDAFGLLFARGTPCDQEYRFQRKDGDWIWLHDRALGVHGDRAIPHADGTSSDITQRKTRERELRESRQQIEDAQALAQIGSWGWDVASDVVTWSAELCRIHGVAAGFRGRYQDFLDRVHPADRARVDGSVRAACAAGSDFAYEERIVRPDGAIRTLHGRGQVVVEAGRPVRMLGICQDVTERVATEAALRESEERFRSIFEWGPLGMVYSRFERERRQTRPNQKFCEMLGYSAEELSRMTVRDITHPDDIAQDLAMWELLGSGEISSYNLQKRYVRKDGTVFWGSLTLCLIGGQRGEDRHALALVEDINERKQSDRLFHGLIESAPDAMVIADREGRIVVVNAQTEVLFGYGRNELLGQPVEVLVPSRLGKKHSAHRQRFLAEPRSRAMGAGMELHGRRRDGSEFPVEVSLSPLQTESGLLVSSAIRDITQRKRAEEKLRIVTERLRALSGRLLEVQEAERRHLARELHDQMGQTLMAIKFSLEAGLRSPDSLGVEQHVRGAVSLLDQLLGEVRSLTLQLRPALLEELGLDAAIRSLLELQAGRAGLAFDFVPLAAPGRLDDRLESACYRVAQEAVSNALRHARATSLQVALRLEGEQLHLVVGDDGVGFDQENVHGRPAESRGFGLLSMEERVRLAGGQLTILSEEGGGSTVRAVFPVGPKPGKGSPGAPSR